MSSPYILYFVITIQANHLKNLYEKLIIITRMFCRVRSRRRRWDVLRRKWRWSCSEISAKVRFSHKR